MTELTSVLTRETELVSRFILVLNQEQTALKSAKPDALATINAEKLQLVDQLNLIGNERAKLANLAGTASDLEKMKVWLQQHPQEKKSASLWVKLLKLAKEAKALHDLNGKLLNIHLQQTTEAIAVLTQQHQEHSLYGSDGQSAMSTGSRIVDSA
jgi:flagella synthesis protein FlgN